MFSLCDNIFKRKYLDKNYVKKMLTYNIFKPCMVSFNNTISLSCHEQVCLSGLRFKRYFSHHRAKFYFDVG